MCMHIIYIYIYIIYFLYNLFSYNFIAYIMLLLCIAIYLCIYACMNVKMAH